MPSGGFLVTTLGDWGFGGWWFGIGVGGGFLFRCFRTLPITPTIAAHIHIA